MRNIKKFESAVILFMCMVALNSFGQTPFTNLVKEPIYLEKIDIAENRTQYRAFTDRSAIANFNNGEDFQAMTDENVDPADNKPVDFFSNNGLTLNLVNQGENRLSVNSQVLHYKLFIANPKEPSSKRAYRYNLPFLVISKLSNNYDSVSASNALDLLDYEAAPITLRLAPSFKLSFKSVSDEIFYGFYADIRGLNLPSSEGGTFNMDFIGSGGVGFTYQGDGEAGIYNSKGEYQPGRYSFSVIFQGATGKKETISALFDTDKNYTTSLQSYLVFKTAKDSALNIKIGYSYFFQETIAGTRSNFSVTLGI